jgi:hypothetical protein
VFIFEPLNGCDFKVYPLWIDPDRHQLMFRSAPLGIAGDPMVLFPV